MSIFTTIQQSGRDLRSGIRPQDLPNPQNPRNHNFQSSTAEYAVDMTNMMTYNRIMISLNINEIKTHFSSFLAKVSKGETVIVCKRNVPIAEITPIAALPNKKRPIGLAGKEYPDFDISDAFFDPLPDDIVAAFNGEGQ